MIDLIELREQLAAIEHERWSRWQRYMHQQCRPGRPLGSGSLEIPAELVQRWERQATTPYAELTEREKASDREQVDRYWPLIEPMAAELVRLHTWRGLMSLVDEHYPPSVFSVADDRPGADDGVRILSLLRRVDEFRTGWAQVLFDQRDVALEALARVRALHKCSGRPYADHCTHCLHPWPCETIQTLGGGHD